MGQPHPSALAFPDFAGQSKTLLCQEGNKTAILVTRQGDGFTQRPIRCRSSTDALQWCRRHAAAMIYLPLIPPVAAN
jgi:hypothetical protein